MDIQIAKTMPALLRATQHLTILAPEAVFKGRRFPQIFSSSLRKSLVELAKEVSPGRLGGTASGFRPGTPKRITTGVLPDTLSRYNSPTRAACIEKVMSAIDLPKKGKTAVVFVLDEPAHVLAAFNATARAFPRFSAKSGNRRAGRIEIIAVDRSGTVVPPPPIAVATAAATRDTAEFVDTPPTELDPEQFAKRARTQLNVLPGVTSRVIKGDALLKENLGGIHAVGRSATVAPRLVIGSYTPRNGAADRLPHVALVGKGITYDTGGLSLKTSNGMVSMKSDMAGAAAVLGAFRVLAANEFPARLSLLLCVAENAIGPASFKPDDILTMHSGRTVEINNTDAEGRLLLADGVSYAAKNLKADVIIDAATLTGAQLISTGLLHAAVISNDADLERLVVDVGRATGDLVHPLPFAPELFQGEFGSAVADMRNSVKNRLNAQTSCAAQFVFSHLADADHVRWCHIDLAGPAYPRNRATGYGVALISQVALTLVKTGNSSQG